MKVTIERFDFFYDTDLSKGLRAYREQDPEGDYVEYEAHVAALASKDRDLAEAQHMLILANNNAAAFQRVAEQRQGEIERLKRAVEWLKDSGVFSVSLSQQYIYGNSGSCDIPAEFADILKPTTGASS